MPGRTRSVVRFLKPRRRTSNPSVCGGSEGACYLEVATQSNPPEEKSSPRNVAARFIAPAEPASATRLTGRPRIREKPRNKRCHPEALPRRLHLRADDGRAVGIYLRQRRSLGAEAAEMPRPHPRRRARRSWGTAEAIDRWCVVGVPRGFRRRPRGGSARSLRPCGLWCESSQGVAGPQDDGRWGLEDPVGSSDFSAGIIRLAEPGSATAAR